MREAVLVFALVALPVAVSAQTGQAPNTPARAGAASKAPPPRPRWRDLPPTLDDLPPPSRGAAAPLRLTNSGLASHAALVASGAHIFGVCWDGGTAPYSVRLQDPAGATIVQEDGVAQTGLVKASKRIQFHSGVYKVLVTDHGGASEQGAFTVVDKLPAGLAWPSDEPGRSDQALLDEANNLADAGLEYRYAAYLALAPRAAALSAEDNALMVRLCHR